MAVHPETDQISGGIYAVDIHNNMPVGGMRLADALWAGEAGVPATPGEVVRHLVVSGYPEERATSVVMASLVTRIAARVGTERQ